MVVQTVLETLPLDGDIERPNESGGGKKRASFKTRDDLGISDDAPCVCDNEGHT